MDSSQGTLTPVDGAPEIADSGSLTPVDGTPDLATKLAEGGGTLTQVNQPPRLVPSWFDDKAARFALGVTKTVGNFMQSVDSAVQSIAPNLVSAQDSQAIQQADAQSHAILNQVEAGKEPLGGGIAPTLDVNPDMAKDFGAKAAQTAGSLFASIGASGGNIVPMTAFSAASAFSEGKNAALDAGKSDDEADEEGAKAAGWASIALPAYAVTGKIASALLNPILQTTNPLLRFGASAAAASVANVGTSAALRAAQGEDATPDAVSLTQDLVFGGLHGIHEAGRPGEVARAKAALDNIEQNYDLGANAVQNGTMSNEDYDAFVAKTQDTWNGLNSFLRKPENQRILEMQQAKGAAVDMAQDVGPATAAATDEEPIDLAQAQEPAPEAETPTDEVPAPGSEEETQPADSIVGMGNATQEEFRVNRAIEGADTYSQLKDSLGREPTLLEWRKEFRAKNPGLDPSEYNQIYTDSQWASHSFDGSQGEKPMVEVVKQMIEQTPENQEIVAQGDESPEIGTKKAAVNEDRADLGLPELDASTPTSERETFEQASRTVQDDPQYQDRVLAEVKANPRSLEPVELAALTMRRIKIRNDMDAAARDIASAHESGDQEALAKARTEYARQVDALNEIDPIIRKANSQSGKNLRAIRTMYKQDYSLPKLIADRVAAKGGKALTPKEEAGLVEMSKRIETLNKQLEEHEQRIQDLQKQIDIGTLKREVRNRSSKRSIVEEREDIIDRLKRKAQEKIGQCIVKYG